MINRCYLLHERPHVKEGPSCPGCGLPNYSGLCPVCRGDGQGYRDELEFAFGPWHEEDGGEGPT